jgi:hypothetical protein
VACGEDLRGAGGRVVDIPSLEEARSKSVGEKLRFGSVEE